MSPKNLMVSGSLFAGCLLFGLSLEAQPARESLEEKRLSVVALETACLGVFPGLQGFWLYLGTSGNVFGQVVDSSGRAVDRAGVAVLTARGVPVATVETRGGYFFAPGLDPRQQLEARISHPEFGEEYFPVEALAGFLPEDLVTLTLLRMPYVVGAVVGIDGSPVAGAKITLKFGDGKGVAASDADGYFHFERISDDPLDLAVEAQGYSLWRQPFAGSRGGLDVGTLQLLPQIEVPGTVVDTAGRPVAGAHISVHSAWEMDPSLLERGSPNEEPWAKSDKSGKFLLAGLPRGNQVQLLVQAQGFIPATVALPESPTSPLEIVLESGAFLRGTVYGPLGPAPLAIVEVKSLVDPQRVGVSTQADGTGHFSLGPLQPGPRTIVAYEGGEYPGGDPIEVPPEGIEGLVLRLKETVDLVGVLLDPEGSPIDSASIEVEVEGGSIRLSSVRNGRFAVEELAAGRAIFRAHHPLYGTTEKSIELHAGMAPLEIRFDEARLSALEITVKAGSEPVAGAQVSVRHERLADSAQESGTDRSGEVAFEGLKPGRTRIEVRHPDFEPYATELTVAPGGDRHFEVSLPMGNRVEGKIRFMPAPELARASLTAQAHDAQGYAAATSIELDRETGNFRLSGLTPGNWDVRLSLGSYRAVTRSIQVGQEPIFIELDWPQD